MIAIVRRSCQPNAWHGVCELCRYGHHLQAIGEALVKRSPRSEGTMNSYKSVIGWTAGFAFALGCGVQDETRSGVGELSLPEDTEVPQSRTALTFCTQESSCPSGLACRAGVCLPCFAHDQCKSNVCDRYAATNLGPGACIPRADVVYANAAARPACETGDGTPSNPVCSIRAAIPLAVGNRYAVRVYPGHYFPFGVSQRTVFLFGPGDGSAVVGEEDISAGARITRQARVVLDGLDFGVSVLNGLIIQDSDVQVRNATINADYRGITSTNSTLVLDRVRANGSVYALRVDGTGSYRITNSYFKGGDFPAVAFTGASGGRFLFNSVLGGGELHPGGIDCGTTSRLIQDSIVVNNFAAAGGAQTVGACTHQRVVVGSGDGRPDAGLIKIDPDLDAQGRLLDTAANAACCIDRGERYVSSLYRDFYGTRRPQGLSNDIGAHERSQVVPASVDVPIRTDLVSP